MACVPLFEDFGSAPDDFLNNDFVDQVKVEACIPSLSHTKGKISFTRKEDGSVTGVFSPSFSYASATLTSDLSTAFPNIKGQLAVKDTLPGFTVKFDGQKDGLKSALQYQSKLFSFITQLDWAKMVGAGAVVAHKGFLAGANVDYQLAAKLDKSGESATQPLTMTTVRAGYQSPVFQMFAFGNLSIFSRLFGLSYLHKLNNRLTVAVGAKLNLPAKKLEGEDVNSANIEVGVEYSPQKNISLKTKINTDSTVGFAYIHNLSNNTRFVASTNVNLGNINRGMQKFGFSLVLFDA